jgi:hypothetical protein
MASRRSHDAWCELARVGGEPRSLLDWLHGS